MTESIVIEPRFAGPPRSAHGGYVAGVLAGCVGGAAVVSLRRPPPLATPMVLERDDGSVRAVHGGDVVATAAPASVDDIEVPEAVPFEEAVDASRRYGGFDDHAFPRCLVCGPERAEGDGLRIFVGPVRERALGAGPWVPHSAFASDGVVSREVVWAALDCPSAWGAWAVEPIADVPVLGTIRGEVVRPPSVGERCVVIGWQVDRRRRTVLAGAAVFGADGELCGRALATWVLIDRERAAALTPGS